MNEISVYDRPMQVRFKYGTRWIVAIVTEVAHHDISLALQWALRETMDPGQIPARFLLGLASVFEPAIRIKSEPPAATGPVLEVDCKNGRIRLSGTREIIETSFFDWLTLDIRALTLEATQSFVC